MQKKIKTSELFAYLYYTLILVGMFFILRSNYTGAAGRIVFFIICLLPAFFHSRVLPYAIITLYCASAYSFFPILPSEWYYYFIVIVFLAYYFRQKPLQSRYVLILVVFLLLDLLHIDIFGENKHFFWMIIAIVFSGFIVTKNGLEKTALMFIVVSLFLSIEYLVFRGRFMEQYGAHIYGLERGGWNNPNGFGGMISLGAGLAVGVLVGEVKVFETIHYRVLCIATIVIATIALVLNASRGSLLAYSAASLLFVVFSSKTKFVYKVLLIVAVVYFVIMIYRSSIAEVLIYRLTYSDESIKTGSGRTIIWTLTLKKFFAESDLIKLIFGVGYTACCDMVVEQNSTHNDFVTALIAYGVIGFVLFLILIFGPLIKAKKEYKKTTAIMLTPLIIECFVLEPIFRGYILYLSYYLFILSYSLIIGNHEKY